MPKRQNLSILSSTRQSDLEVLFDLAPMSTNSQEELLNEQIAGLSPAKRALLELKLKKHTPKSAFNGFIPRRPHHSPTPVSFAQQRLWFLSELEPDSPAYNIPVARRLSGPLNVKALEQALGEIVKRHESLRTRFDDVGGVPQQVIDEAGEWKLKLVDLSSKDEKERMAAAERLASEEAQRPFALAREWGLRGQLLRLSEREHILLLTMHHIVSDGWSLGVLFGELKRLYEGYSRSEHYAGLPELGLQYADFAVWQREWLGAAELQKQLSYWKEQLAGITPLELPLDRVRPAAPSYRGEKQTLHLSTELSRQLQALARDEEATLFMVLLAAFQVLLSRYSGQSDISVGTPIANRTRPQLEELIGFFVNTLVLRTDVSGDPSFIELLERVREVALAAYAHQDLPFEKLVEELHPERSLSRNPLFDVLFVVQNTPRSEGLLGEMRLESWGEGGKTTRLDLEVHVSEGAKGLVCTFVYATDLFTAETIRRLMGHYEQLLGAVVADARQRVSELPLLTSAEQEHLRQWNETSSAYPQQSIPELFEAQAQQQGGAVAVRCGAAELSYAQLNERANQLAHYLRAQGISAETRVGVCMERSLELVVGLLGVLKAGGDYVPLDPSYPQARLEYMVADAGVKLLLTQSSLEKKWQESGLQLVELDRQWKEIGNQSGSNPSLTINPDNLAYVLYTSGSTGKPKGVVSAHRASINRFEWMWRTYPFAEGEVCCQKTSISFGDSIWEIFGPLLQGVPFVILDDDTVKDPKRFITTLSHYRVSRLVLVPSLLRAILEVEENLAERLPSLRYCICSGETLPVELATAFRQKLPHTMLLNLYGSSEVAADVTSYEVTTTESLSSVPIGKPIANTQTYILDKQLKPVPIGVAGDLYIAGVGLARGYLNSKDLTAEKFIPDQFSGTGARMFCTGDVARYLQDGNIEFLGRRDHQVKIRGFRIETAEIELALREHRKVRQAVVSVRQVNSGEKRLVAYLVLQAEQAITIDELRVHLQESLPDYMIPAAFVVLDELPLTPSGKVDRQQLPEPDAERSELAGSFVAPRTPVEQQVALIWEQVLNVKGVGVEDDFFTLGGHSLLATRLMSRLNHAFGLRLPLRTLFEAPSVRRIAEIITSTESYVWPTVMKIQPLGTRRPMFFVAAPDINALGYIRLAQHLGDDQPVYGLQSQKYLKTTTDEHGRALLEFSQAVVEELAHEYVRAMREVQPHGPYLLGGMCRGAHIAFEMATQLKAQGETVSLLAMLDTWVMENTYSYLFYLDYYYHRTQWFLKLRARDKFSFLKNKIRRSLDNAAVRLRLREGPHGSSLPPVTAVYWPDSSFVPSTYDGRITVFRVPDQPATRIRSHSLGWEQRAAGGVHVEVLPGGHQTLLREPHVQVLASRLTKILTEIEAGTSNHHPD